MDTMKSLIQNSDGLGFAIATMTLIYSIYSFKSTISRQISKEQHEKLISPMFFLLESHLFKSINNDVSEEVFDLIDQNKHLADGKLLEIIYFYSKNSSQSNYNILCSYTSNAYDKSCKRLGLKLRSIEYRLSRKQYQSKMSLLFYLVIVIGKSISLFVALFLAFLLIAGLGTYWFENISSPENQTIFLFFIGVLLLFLLNRLEDKC